MRTLSSGSLPSVHLIWVLWAISPMPWAVSVGSLHRWQQSPYQLHTGVAQHFFMATGSPSAHYGYNRHQTRCSIVSIPLPTVHSKNKERIVTLNKRDSCRKIALHAQLVLYNRSILLEDSQHTYKWVKDSLLETQNWRSGLWLLSNPCWIMHVKITVTWFLQSPVSPQRQSRDPSCPGFKRYQKIKQINHVILYIPGVNATIWRGKATMIFCISERILPRQIAFCLLSPAYYCYPASAKKLTRIPAKAWTMTG